MTHIKAIRFAVVGGLCLLAAGCDLEQNPVSSTDANAVFTSETGLELYTNSFYGVLPSASSVYHGDTMTDYAAVRGVNAFLQTASYTPTSRGSWSWTTLRNINYFLVNNTRDEVSETLRNNYSGIARFFRALFYFDKVKTHGAVPWIDRPLDIDDAQLFAGRDSRDVVMNHVLEDLDYAIANIGLETDPTRTRITKDVALAWKSRIALFEGTFRKYHADGLAAGLEGTADFWLGEAAAAARAVMDRGNFDLYTGGGLEQSYRQLFSSETAPAIETMLVQVHDVNLAVRHDANWVYTSATTGQGFSFIRPFIHTYLKIDGTPFTDTPGYETMTYMEETRGRDLRLQQTIRVGDFKRLSAGVLVPSPPLFSQTLTGYMPIKWTIDDIGLDAGSNNTNDIPIFRYAEVLLNYAEARAELGTLTNADWTETIGALRARAGITGGLTSLPTVVDPYLRNTYFPDISDPVILEVRRERGVELATEGLRFADILRWKRGELMEMPWAGFYVPSVNEYLDLNEDGAPDVYFHRNSPPTPQVPGVFYINVADPVRNTLTEGDRGELLWLTSVPRVWEEKKYLYPIAQADLTVNPALGQNPGW